MVSCWFCSPLSLLSCAAVSRASMYHMPKSSTQILHPHTWISQEDFLDCVILSNLHVQFLFNFFPNTFSRSSKEKPGFPFKSFPLKFKFFLQASFSFMNANEFSYVFCHFIKDFFFAHFWSHAPHLLLCLSKGLFYIHFPITLLFVIICAHYLGWQIFSVTFSSIPSEPSPEKSGVLLCFLQFFWIINLKLLS